MLTCRRPMHIYMYMVNQGPGPPPPPPDVPWWVGQGPCGCYYLIFSFIPGSICSTVMNIRVFTNIAGFYGKTLFSFILFIVARFSTKIKHFLGEDGYILYKID